jgi:hypothetical protein
MLQNGPANALVKSKTLIPASGNEVWLGRGMKSFKVV